MKRKEREWISEVLRTCKHSKLKQINELPITNMIPQNEFITITNHIPSKP